MKARYELTVIFPEKEEEYREKTEKFVKDFVKKSSGEMVEEEEWGVRRLAYPIKKKETGYYKHFVIKIDTEDQPILEKKLALEEKILRYLFVRV